MIKTGYKVAVPTIDGDWMCEHSLMPAMVNCYGLLFDQWTWNERPVGWGPFSAFECFDDAVLFARTILHRQPQLYMCEYRPASDVLYMPEGGLFVLWMQPFERIIGVRHDEVPSGTVRANAFRFIERLKIPFPPIGRIIPASSTEPCQD